MNLRSTLLDIPFVYNLVQTVLGFGFYKTAKTYIDNYRHESVLEIGCGTGELLKHVRVKKYLGLDINDSYLSYARKTYGNKNIKFLNMDATEIAPQNDRYDLVVIVNIIHHFNDAQFTSMLSRVKTNIDFDRLIIIDGKPDIGVLNPFLEWADQGGNFRELPRIKKIIAQYFTIQKAIVFKKPYWFYKSPMVVAVK